MAGRRNISIAVETVNLDEAIAKAKELRDLLQQIQQLIADLKS